MSDDRPEYIGKDYKLFLKQWDFKHDSSCPHYSKSNGQIERTTQTIEKTVKKAFKSNNDPFLALLALQTSPGPNNNKPPHFLKIHRSVIRKITIDLLRKNL